jgi:hypothetical protein
MTLKLGSGLLWSLAYVLIIWRGFRDRTYGMPVAALCANLSWEFIFSFLYPHALPQSYVNRAWFVLDLIILAQICRYAPDEFKHMIPRRLFFPALALGIVLAFLLILFITHEFHDADGRYSAFGQNLMMSILFVAMLLRRQSLRGQSIYIAVSKLLGTLLPSVLVFLTYPESPLLNTLHVGILVFDVTYVVLVARALRG